MKEAESIPTTETNGKTCLEYLRHSLKGLPKPRSLYRVQIAQEHLQNNFESRRTFQTSAESDVSKRRREYTSVQKVTEENEKFIVKESEAGELGRKDNKNLMEIVKVLEEDRGLSAIAYQNRMIDLRNQLSSVSLYTEEELIAEMNDRKDEAAAFCHSIALENEILVSSKQNIVDDCSSLKNNVGFMAQCDIILSRKLLQEIKSMESEMKRAILRK